MVRKDQKDQKPISRIDQRIIDQEKCWAEHIVSQVLEAKEKQ